MRQQLRLLGENVRVDVFDAEAALPEKIRGSSKKLQARHSFVLRIRIGKQFSDIAETSSTQQGIDNRVTQHVAVGMCNKTPVVRNFHTAESQMRSRTQPMQIEAQSDSELHEDARSSWRKNRASARSPGRVILILRSEPRTTATGSPKRSTRLDSSVP